MPAKRLGRKERRKLYTSLAGEVTDLQFEQNEVDAFILSYEAVVLKEWIWFDELQPRHPSVI